MKDQENLVDSFLSDVKKQQKRSVVLLIAITAFLAVIGLAVLLYSTREVKQKIKNTQTLENQVNQIKSEMEENSRSSQQQLTEKENKLNEQERKLQASQKALETAKAGIKAYHQGRYEEAVVSYDKALEEDPNNAYLWNLKGYSLFKAHHYDDSIAAFQKAVQVDPQYAWGYFDLARVYCAIKKTDAAATSIQEAIRLRPDLKSVAARDGEFVRLCGASLLQ